MILLLCVVWHRIESPFAHVCFVLFFFKSLINFSWSRAGPSRGREQKEAPEHREDGPVGPGPTDE